MNTNGTYYLLSKHYALDSDPLAIHQLRSVVENMIYLLQMSAKSMQYLHLNAVSSVVATPIICQ